MPAGAWIGDIADSMVQMTDINGAFRVLIEDDDLAHTPEFRPSLVSDTYAVNGAALQSVYAGLRFTIEPVARSRCPEIVVSMVINGAWETSYVVVPPGVVIIDDEGLRRVVTRSPLDTILDDMTHRIEPAPKGIYRA
mgnify:CR=1 FL=1